MPSRDAQWVIGTIILAVIALSVQLGGLSARIDRLEARLDARIDALDDRLRAVEVAFGKVDQRLATLERLHLPTPGDGD